MDSNKRKHRNYLTSNNIFSCNSCHCHLIDQKSIISRNFQGRVSISPKFRCCKSQILKFRMALRT